MEKIRYRLTTLSSLIVSPRSSLAWYKDLGEFDPENFPDSKYLKNKKNLRVLYPFYQYGEYVEWSDCAEYYLPGSSVKGALNAKNYGTGTIMVDDVLVPKESIVVRNLYKAQYLGDSDKGKMGVFFDNLGVEMVKANAELYGELYMKEAGDVVGLLEKANGSAKIKMRQMKEYLAMLFEREYEEELQGILHNAINELESLVMEQNVIILGGYKGLLHSMEVTGSFSLDLQQEYGAVYVDPESGLLHGLTRFEVLS